MFCRECESINPKCPQHFNMIDRKGGVSLIEMHSFIICAMVHGQELGEFSHIDAQSYQHFIENYPRENSWLVVWNIFSCFFHILGIIIPTDQYFFRGVETC
jgi:hypothetical protein